MIPMGGVVVMFGFIYRLYIQHPDDEENDLIYLQLSKNYTLTGLFMAGKSYMMRSKTKNESKLMLYEIMLLEKKLPDPTWRAGLGYYTIRQHKEMYIVALMRYINSLTRIDDAFRYITDSDKKLEYLTDKLRKLNPNYKSDLFKADMQMRKQWDWHIYRYRQPPAISGAYREIDDDLAGFS